MGSILVEDCQVGSLAGATHLSKDNAGVLRLCHLQAYAFYKHLASLLSDKWTEQYSSTLR